MKNEKYILYPFGMKAICPECAGILTIMGEYGNYKCFDCKSNFKVLNDGINDKSVICSKIRTLSI